MIRVLMNGNKRRLVLNSMAWALRCYAKGLISGKSALGHVQSTYSIVSFKI